MSKISKNVLDKIDKKHIKPTPKWQFILLHALMWIAFGASIILGAIAFSVILLHLLHTEWALIGRIKGGPIGGTIIMLPYIWFALIVLMIFVSTKLFEKTKKGYKHHTYIIIGLSIGLSMVLGSIMYSVKTADFVENAMRTHLKPYADLQDMRDKAWLAPENGLLMGRIAEIKSDKLIIVNDITGQKWDVDIEDAKLAKDITLTTGKPIVITGEQTGDTDFKADFIKFARISNPTQGMKGPGNGIPKGR